MRRLQPLFVGLPGGWVHHDGQRRHRANRIALGGLSDPPRRRRRHRLPARIPKSYGYEQTWKRCPVFIGGEWQELPDFDTSPVYNPSRGEVIAEVPLCGADVVNEAVEAAAAAFPAWRETPPVERARLFFRYRQLVEENFDRICQLVTREHGKTLAEARGQRLSRHREHRIRLRHSDAPDGRHSRKPRARGRLRDDAPAARRLRRHHAVQLPGDGADVDVPARARLRQHLRPETERESSADRDLSHRVTRERPACPKAFSTSFTAAATASTRFSLIPKVSAISFVGSTPDRETHFRNRHPPRQTRAGQRRRQELHRHYAGCRCFRTRSKHSRRPPSAAPANVAWPARPRSPSAPRPSDASFAWSQAARAIKVGPTDVKPRSPTWDRSLPRSIATAF